MNKDIAIGIILYNPAANSLNRIINHANERFPFIVYSNSLLSAKQISDLRSNNNILLISNEKNMGIAAGLNSICRAAIQKNYRGLVYFDQDTVFSNETLEYISRYYSFILEERNELIHSLACTTFRDSIPLNRKLNFISEYSIAGYRLAEVYFTINSGSLYFLDNYNDYTWFDENFFVDGIDYYFCLESLKRKHKITEIHSTPGLDHSEEQGNEKFGIFKNKKSVRLYPIKRNADFILSHSKLFLLSFSIPSCKPKIFLLRAIFIYLILQLSLRIKRIPKIS